MYNEPSSLLTWPRRLFAPRPSAQIEALTQMNLASLLDGLGVNRLPHGQRGLEWLLKAPARHFARRVATYDQIVGAAGLQVGASWMHQHYSRGLAISGQAHVPAHGPLLIVSNHPGLTDTIALFAAIARPDLRVVAAHRPFLAALPHTSRYLLNVSETTSERLGLVRAVTRHLRNDGAVLLFPGGKIEPDPAVLPGASAALDHWSASMSLFVRLARNVTILPVIVSGVLSRAALNHPLTRLRSTHDDRVWMAATLQILLPALRDIIVHVRFGRPIRTADLHASNDPQAISRAVLTEARRLIALTEPTGNS